MNKARTWVILSVLGIGALFLGLINFLSKPGQPQPASPLLQTKLSESNQPPPAHPAEKASRPAPAQGRNVKGLEGPPDPGPPPYIPPEVEAKIGADLKAKRVGFISGIYQDYFKAVKLPADKQAQMVEALAEAERRLFQQTTSTGAPTPPTPEMLQQNDVELNRQLRGILNEQELAEYQGYRRSVPDRIMVQQFGRECAGNPVSEEQSQQLVRIMQEERERVLSQQSSINTDGLSPDQMRVIFETGFQQINQAVLQRAQTILTPEQNQTLFQIQQRFGKNRP